MAAAAAVVCPCFSSASTTTTTTTNARLPQYEAAPRMLTRTRLPRTRATAIGLSVWSPRSPKISVAVAQEEAAAAEVEVEEVEEGTVAEGGEEEEEEEKQWKLYFGNLPYHCGSAQLAGIIQEFGSPEMVEVLYDRETGRSRGFAFVTMSSMEDAEAVIQNLDGREFGGRTLRVNFSDKPRPKEPLYPETEFKLFVGNLSWTVTSEILAKAFQEYGNIVGARVLYDGDTGRSRGYGFVCYSSRPEMEAALISLNGLVLEGRAMRVSLAMGKKS